MNLTGRAKLAGVIGWPVAHSRSPALHGHWLARYGIDGAYVPLPIQPTDFEAAIALLPRMGFVGVNVTLPLKGMAFRLATRHDLAAVRTRAVNTLIFRDGAIEGRNTDVSGFIDNVRQHCPDFAFAAHDAVVLGAGGAARGVIVGLLLQGVRTIRLVNRTKANAESLAADLGGPIEIYEWAELSEALDGAGLLVNTSSAGMEGHDRLSLSLDSLPRSALVTDIVYTPLETELLAAARQRGNPTVDGLGMLLHQARPGFAAWFGIEPAIDDRLRAAVL